MRSLGITEAKVCTIDEEIEHIEKLVDAGKIKHMPCIALQEVAPEVYIVYTLSMATPLNTLREMLKMSLQSVEDMIGKEKPPCDHSFKSIVIDDNGMPSHYLECRKCGYTKIDGGGP